MPSSDDVAFWRTDPDVLTMERLRDGDTDAFQLLFRKYNGAIAGFAGRYLGTGDRAEEVTQAVFLKLFQARERYEPKARFATYLYRIARNACLNEIRRIERRRDVESLDAENVRGGASLTDRWPDVDSPEPVNRLACRKALAEVNELLKGLPSKQREALLLSRVDGLSYREVADSLDSTTSAVKSLVFRATARLRRELAEIL